MSELQQVIARAHQHQTAQGSGLRGTMPAPVRGLNTRDPEANMHPAFAIALDNWFPESGVIRTRGGSRIYADTGDTEVIGTLVPQISGSDRRLFALSDSKLYNVTEPDEDDPTMDVDEVTLPAAITNSRWRSANLNGFVILVNGIDDPFHVKPDGTAADAAFSIKTGHTLTGKLNHVVSHQNRLFFSEANSTKLWYGGLRAITGDIASIDLGLVDAAGGNIAALGTLSLDSGEGVDDLLAVVTENGTVFLYGGTNPAMADSWSLKGVYRIGTPVGDKPLMQLGGDLTVITVDGFVPLLQFIRGGRSQAHLALSDPIGSLVRDSARDHGTQSGWEAVLYSPAGWVLFNTPRRAGESYQLVMNSQTKAWTRFTGMPAECWATWNDRLFFGAAAGKVWEANVGTADGGEPIKAFCRTAYSTLGSPYPKRGRRLRAHVESPTTEPVSVGISADYDRTPPPPVPAQLGVDGATWNKGRWNRSQWGSGVARHREWKKVSSGGVAFSVTVAADLRTDRAVYFGSDILYDQSKGAAT